MLRNVLDEYLAGIRRERDFDAPFLALLAAMGYEDIHLTHGTTEKGKDFIAKRYGAQWVFQSKKGDIGTSEARDVIAQLVEASMMGLSHPSFDATLARRVVLVTTGLIKQDANDRFASFSTDALAKLGMPPMEAWGRPKLIELMLTHGVEGLRATRLRDVEAHGRFFALYGAAVRRAVVIREIEEHSLSWLDSEHDERELTLLGATEAAILSSKCADGGLLYESWQCELAALRMSMARMYGAVAPRREQLQTLCLSQLETCVAAARTFTQTALDEWEAHERRLDRAIRSPSVFLTYPVHAMRIAEALAFLSLYGDENSGESSRILLEFLAAEPGASRPISDRYAVSVVAICLALVKAGEKGRATEFAQGCASWVLDRFEFGNGLAHVDSSVQEEVDYLLGASFSTLPKLPKLSSLLAAALMDLVAFVRDENLYSNLFNDLHAVEVAVEYYQPLDTPGQFVIEHRDIHHYTAVSYLDELPTEGTPHSDYGRYEPPVYAMVEELPASTYVALFLLLRDRYFPSLWPIIIG